MSCDARHCREIQKVLCEDSIIFLSHIVQRFNWLSSIFYFSPVFLVCIIPLSFPALNVLIVYVFPFFLFSSFFCRIRIRGIRGTEKKYGGKSREEEKKKFFFRPKFCLIRLTVTYSWTQSRLDHPLWRLQAQKVVRSALSLSVVKLSSDENENDGLWRGNSAEKKKKSYPCQERNLQLERQGGK